MPHLASSAITEVVHDRATASLAIRFASGEAYAYRGVSAEVYAGLIAAPSKGAFFQAEIRDVYPFVRLSADGA
jgi:hypothetical protein